MSDVAVREATSEDVSGIRRVAERAWRAAYGEFLPPDVIDEAMAEWYDPEATRTQARREDVAYFVADDGGVVGYVSGGPGESPTVARLGAIYVDPDRWGDGVGTALLSRFESWCRRRDHETVELRVLAENDIGSSFYRARGYEPVDEVKRDLFGETVPERTFRRRLEG
ncbi:MAG: N-acetyltransferase family protein [Natronomonas sp.]